MVERKGASIHTGHDQSHVRDPHDDTELALDLCHRALDHRPDEEVADEIVQAGMEDGGGAVPVIAAIAVMTIGAEAGAEDVEVVVDADWES